MKIIRIFKEIIKQCQVYYCLAVVFKILALFFEVLTIFIIIPIFHGGNYNNLVNKISVIFQIKYFNCCAQADSSPVFALFLFLIVGLGFSTSKLMGNLFANKVNKTILDDFRIKILNKVSVIDIGNSTGVDTAKLNHQLNFSIKDIAYAVSLSTDVFPTVIMILMLVALALFFSFKITIFIASFLITLLFIFFLCRKRISKNSYRSYVHSQGIMNTSKVFFYNLKYFKVNYYFDFIIPRIKKNVDSYSESYFAVEKMKDVIGFFYESLGICFIFLFLTFSIMYGKSISSAMFLILLIYRVSPGVVSLQSKIISIQSALNAYLEYEELLNSIKVKSEHRFNIADSDVDNVQLRKGSFKISTTGNELLVNKEIIFLKDKNYLIKGLSGAGKSTLIDLILGNLKSSDLVFVNGTAVCCLDDITFSNLFTYSSDQLNFIKGTIRENICYGKEVDEEQLDLVMRMTGLNEVLFKKEIDLNYSLDDSRLEFSSGELQRIALSRVLLKNSIYLILDEAMNSLDSKSERYILEEIITKRKGKSLIYVSHRKGLEDVFDEVIEVRDGYIS